MTITSHIKALHKGVKPDPFIDFVKWSNTYRRLPKESSVEPGRYRTSRTPYLEEILMGLSPQSPTEECVVIKPTQVGFTERDIIIK
jgi:phage terminase large subunit GpA-like protein